MKKAILLLALTVVSCFPGNCIETTYLNGQEYSVYEYAPTDGECFCEEYSYFVDGDLITNSCSRE
ncbi:hypothetical protein DRO61_11415 [Candidatus Bathyarchaeota archaeon]|jgi:hypothetical protein|nr:MAG: hypothetical protein DRO61_11415 [Candidatus Bathyarchaeota archaeon]